MSSSSIIHFTLEIGFELKLTFSNVYDKIKKFSAQSERLLKKCSKLEFLIE